MQQSRNLMNVVWDALAARNSFEIKTVNAKRNRVYNLSKLLVPVQPAKKQKQINSEEESDPKVVETHDLCLFCREGGTLILCDHTMCPNVAHAACAAVTKKQLKDKTYQYFCPQHARRVLGRAVEEDVNGNVETSTPKTTITVQSSTPDSNAQTSCAALGATTTSITDADASQAAVETSTLKTTITVQSSTPDSNAQTSCAALGAPARFESRSSSTSSIVDPASFLTQFSEKLSFLTMKYSSMNASSLTPAVLNHLRKLELLIIEVLDTQDEPQVAASALDATTPPRAASTPVSAPTNKRGPRSQDYVEDEEEEEDKSEVEDEEEEDNDVDEVLTRSRRKAPVSQKQRPCVVTNRTTASVSKKKANELAVAIPSKPRPIAGLPAIARGKLPRDIQEQDITWDEFKDCVVRGVGKCKVWNVHANERSFDSIAIQVVGSSDVYNVVDKTIRYDAKSNTVICKQVGHLPKEAERQFVHFEDVCELFSAWARPKGQLKNFSAEHETLFRTLSLVRVDCGGNGDCFYHCCHFLMKMIRLDATESTHAGLRTATMDHFRANYASIMAPDPTQFAGPEVPVYTFLPGFLETNDVETFVQQYCDTHGLLKAWVEDPIIRVFADLKNITIHVYHTSHMNPIIINPDACDLMKLWCDGGHYMVRYRTINLNPIP